MEGKILFENVYKPTEEDITEFVSNKQPDSSPVTALVCLVVVIIAGLVWLQIIPADIIDTRPWVVVPAILLVALIVYINVTIKKASLKRAIDSYFRENSNALDEHRTYFYEDHFTSRDVSFKYSEISDLVYGASCMYIVLKNGQMIVIKDDSTAFRKGIHAKFWPFLEARVNVIAKQKRKRTKMDALRLFRQ